MQAITFAILLIGASSIFADEVAVQNAPVEPSPAAVVAAVQSAPAVGQVQPAQSDAVQPASVVVVGEHHQQQHQHQQSHPQAPVHHYSHQVVSDHQPGSIANRPIASQHQPVHHYSSAQPQVVGVEQYGQPESASIPANYKPFGSWGLYIGGNPADGYYTNYYKSLGSSIEKQVPGSGQQVAPESVQKPPVGPLLRQASGSVYGVGAQMDQVYPFEHSYYTPAELNSGSTQRFVSPVQAGSQSYGTPSASYEPGSSLLSYSAESVPFYAKKGPIQREVPVVQQQQQAAKGYQARYGYVYQSSPVVQASAAPFPQQPPQVVAYPVPVGSQIVGSQPGIDNGLQPYGVHAFTRYAIKPTVVSGSEQSSVYYAPVAAPVVHSVGQPKQVYHHQQHYHQPLNFYGYPVGQLHYSTGSLVGNSAQSTGVVSANQQHEHAAQPVVDSVVSSSDKVESHQDKQQ